MRAKPQPSAMLNQSCFALTWSLSPFLLPLLPQLAKKACTQELLWLFPTTAHHTRRHAEEQSLGALIQRPKQVAHKNQQRNTTAARAPGWPSFRLRSSQSDLADTGETEPNVVSCAAGVRSRLPGCGSVRGTEGEDTLSSAAAKPGLASSTALATPLVAFSSSHLDNCCGLLGTR